MDVKTAKHFVRAAMGEALAGKPVSTASTTPYGCTVTRPATATAASEQLR